MRAHRAYAPSSAAATPETSRYQSSDTEEWRESSSSGSASPMRGPGSAGWKRYIQPVAATPTSSTTGNAAVLRMPQPLRRGEVGARSSAAPDRPVVAAVRDGIAVREVQLRERLRELVV